MIDKLKFELIYNEHKNLVYNLCLNYVLNTEDAQDISQEVFVKVYENYYKFNPNKASIKTWIYRITINTSLDFIKAKKTKKRLRYISSIFNVETNEPIIVATTINHPGLITENKEALENLFKIIQTLPEKQKTAIILSKIEDRSQSEVAEIMNTSVKAIESLLQRAKQNIQNKLTQNEGFK